MPNRAKKVVKEAPKPVVKKTSDSVADIRKAIKDHKNPTKLILGKKSYEGVRMDPWFGDNGEVQTFDGVTIVQSREEHRVEVR